MSQQGSKVWGLPREQYQIPVRFDVAANTGGITSGTGSLSNGVFSVVTGSTVGTYYITLNDKYAAIYSVQGQIMATGSAVSALYDVQITGSGLVTMSVQNCGATVNNITGQKIATQIYVATISGTAPAAVNQPCTLFFDINVGRSSVRP